jgi:hypothetical protein
MIHPFYEYGKLNPEIPFRRTNKKFIKKTVTGPLKTFNMAIILDNLNFSAPIKESKTKVPGTIVERRHVPKNRPERDTFFEGEARRSECER